jgi:hypothetical protein
MTAILVVMFAGAGVVAGVRGIRLLRWSLRNADEATAALWLVRGIRGIVTGVAGFALAGGVLFEATWSIVFGVVFLAEELYETGVLALVLRGAGRSAGGL